MTRAERSQEKARYWRSLVEEHARSGQQDGEFCRERGIGIHTLRAWRYRFAREAALRRARRATGRPHGLSAVVDFVPVRVAPVERTPHVVGTTVVRTDSGSGVELVLGRDRVVRIERGFAAPPLGNSCPCASPWRHRRPTCVGPSTASRCSCGKSCARTRYWDGGGLCLFYKFPHVEGASVEIEPTQLALLLEGIDFENIDRPRRCVPKRSLATQPG